jgi:hypothetical protein
LVLLQAAATAVQNARQFVVFKRKLFKTEVFEQPCYIKICNCRKNIKPLSQESANVEALAQVVSTDCVNYVGECVLA